MKLKKLLLLFIMISALFLNGCLGSREVNDIAINISIGIDKSEEGYLITNQILNPKAVASKSGASESPVIINTKTGTDLFETIRSAVTYSPRKLYNAHLRTIIFGEAFAKEGVQKVLDFFVRDHEFRTDYYFCVAKGTTANEILKTITPLESVSGLELFDSIEAAEKNYAPTKSVKILSLVNTLLSDGKNPVLAGVEIKKLQDKSTSIDALKETDPSKIKLAGLGIFKKDRLQGWLSDEESKGYNYITGNITDTVGYVNVDNTDNITFEVIKVKSKFKAFMSDDKPSINVEINVLYNIAAQTGTFDVSTEANSDKIRRLVEENLKELCISTIKKAQTEYKSDIFGFGEEIHRTYPKLWAKLKNDWNTSFIKLPVNVVINAKVNGLGENTKSIFSKESSG
ncbi:spore germination protein KC [Ruminiclostridium sufflavum DSM 19573]|uniref:Spore germination protein KC n=1 Tax=Ruminiclostridium sufflavum DSM 19573 TaxID=1121337 RepID=A0A318XUJ8_9FIRM|nr:Ger(x)C family spore germination protein [Ruminiclostridium sufflavum]PYG90340.1 spore germination protein KC [Ruminiclostridium sufflavum DSM 19573]